MAPIAKALCFLLLCLVLLTGCADITPTPTPAPEPTAAPIEDEESNETTINGESRQLVLWLPAFANPTEDSVAGAVLEGAFFQFEQNHPGLSLDVQLKAEYGQAGLLNYLRSAQRTAPSIMPDLVLLHSSQLWQVADLGIVAPLEDAEIEFAQEFYPFSLDALTYRNQLYGVPYTVNILHAVTIPRTDSTPEAAFDGAPDEASAETATDEPLSTAQDTAAESTANATSDAATADVASTAETSSQTGIPVDRTTPVNWDMLLANDGYYIFPAGGIEGFRLASGVMHYRAAGGTLEEEGAPAADPNALETFFEFIILAHRNGLIPELVLEHTTYESLWAAFDGGEGDLALISAQEFLNQPDMSQFEYLPVPTASGEPATIGNAWGFAVLTRDENLRPLAFELIKHLLAPDIHGPWSLAAQRLPSQPAALANWGGAQGEYVAFLDTQFQVVESIPTGRPFADFTRHLHLAQSGLLRGELNVEEAIQEARTQD